MFTISLISIHKGILSAFKRSGPKKKHQITWSSLIVHNLPPSHYRNIGHRGEPPKQRGMILEISRLGLIFFSARLCTDADSTSPALLQPISAASLKLTSLS